jgi:hypothetical protein
VRAALDDAAVVDDEDLVGLADRREAVGDHERRAAGERRLERQLHGDLGLRVEVGGGLVEHDDVGRLEQQPGDGDALLLAARQPVAAVADHGVEAVGQRLDQRQDLRGPQRLDQLVLGGVGLGVEQVGGSCRGTGGRPG